MGSPACPCWSYRLLVPLCSGSLCPLYLLVDGCTSAWLRQVVPNQFETRFRSAVIDPILPFIPAFIHPNVITMTSMLIVCGLGVLGISAQVCARIAGVHAAHCRNSRDVNECFRLFSLCFVFFFSTADGAVDCDVAATLPLAVHHCVRHLGLSGRATCAADEADIQARGAAGPLYRRAGHPVVHRCLLLGHLV
jgi:hypothetical protein